MTDNKDPLSKAVFDSPMFAFVFVATVLFGLAYISSEADHVIISVSLCETEKGALFVCSSKEECKVLRDNIPCQSFKTKDMSQKDARTLRSVLHGRNYRLK